MSDNPPVLILSSHVAAGHVGGSLQVVALAGLGLDPILAPTVLFGRHPGLGAPGGEAVDDVAFAGVLRGIEAHGVFPRLGAVITGYFASPAQVVTAAGAIDAIRAVNPRVPIVVDPIMGDFDKGLYVPQAVAAAIAADLVPRADIVTPNVWELRRLTGGPTAEMDVGEASAAAHALGKAVLVSSVGKGGAIGFVYDDGRLLLSAEHARQPAAPKGTGDLLTALYVAGLILGMEPQAAFGAAASALVETIRATAVESDLDLTGLAGRFRRPSGEVVLTKLSAPGQG